MLYFWLQYSLKHKIIPILIYFINYKKLLKRIKTNFAKSQFGRKGRRLWYHCKPIPVMKTGFSLCSVSHREKPVFITWEPCIEDRLFPAWKYYTGKTLFWPCTGPVRDCSVLVYYIWPKLKITQEFLTGKTQMNNKICDVQVILMAIQA